MKLDWRVTNFAHRSALPETAPLLARSDRDTENRGPEVLTAAIVLTILTTILVSARLVLRVRKFRRLSSDDCLIILATVCSSHLSRF
jgi:hypothetical protein